MLKNIIIIQGENQVQCDIEQDVVRQLIAKDYYEKTPEEKLETMKLKAIANSIGKENIEILEEKDIRENIDLENKFVLLDEKTYVLSLLENTDVTILEHKSSDIYTAELDKSKFTKNYIIVNNFAKDVLKKYMEKFYKK